MVVTDRTTRAAAPGGRGTAPRAAGPALAGVAALIWALAVGCGVLAPAPEPPADLILTGGHVLTRPVQLDQAGASARAGEVPVANVTWLTAGTAVCVRDGAILHVGDDKSTARYRGPDTHVIDLDGAWVVPGLTDAHGHVFGLGQALRQIDLVGTGSAEEVAAAVRERAASVRPGEWITGRGWDQNDWRATAFPDRGVLDAAAPDNPVFLERIDGHAVWVNGPALEAAGIDATTPDPHGGRLLRDADGEPTGILVDRASSLVERALPEPGSDERAEILGAALARLAAAGVTSVHDAGVDRATLQAYRALAKTEGRLPVRVYALIGGEGDLLDAYLASGPEVGSTAGTLTVRGVKLVADGAMGSRGAALLEDYADQPGNRGLLILDARRIEAITAACLASGLQVATHAIGDRAVREVLDGYEAALSAHEKDAPSPRLRLEHVQHVRPEDLPRLARLGVIASMQPTHATSDMPWVGRRLGAGRMDGSYAWRSLLASGAVIAAGSDFPVESHRPLLGLHSAVTRQDEAGRPAGRWMPAERMSPAEALAAFTISAAYAAFAEDRRGLIEPGNDADLTVLTGNPLDAGAGGIPSLEVSLTIVGGRVVFSRDAAGLRARQDVPRVGG